MLKRVSVELWFVRSTKNVGAILVIALYSVIANYELRITNYGEGRDKTNHCMRRVRADSPTRSRLRRGARPKSITTSSA